MKDYTDFTEGNEVSELINYVAVQSHKKNIIDIKILYNNFVTILFKLSFMHKINKKETQVLNDYIEHTYKCMQEN